MKNFKNGDLVAFIGRDGNGEIYKVEIGKFKGYNENKKDVGFVYYHSGPTAAGTDIRDLFHINNHMFIETNLGGKNETKS